MNGDPKNSRHEARHKLEEEIALKQARRLKARREGERSAWFGLGMFGLVGWSVAVPALIGVAVGIWIDRRWPSQYSWTLTLLILGVAIGCLNAWWWVQRESQRPDDDPTIDGDDPHG